MLPVGPPIPGVTYVASRVFHTGGNIYKLSVGPLVLAVTYVASRASRTGDNVCC
jgi:hypothetical protein